MMGSRTRISAAAFVAVALAAGVAGADDLISSDPLAITAPTARQAAPERPRRHPGFVLLSLEQRNVKWGAPVPGVGAVISYAFVEAPVARPGATNCRTMAPLDAALVEGGIGEAEFRAEVRAAMDVWEAAADVRFVAAAPEAAALLIGAQGRPEGIAFADVEHDSARPAPMASIAAAAVCFNPLLRWESGFDGDPATPDVRYVAAHELGHVLGLDHAWGDDKLMSYKNRERVRGPQADDAAGAVALYGRPAATALTPLPVRSPR